MCVSSSKPMLNFRMLPLSNTTFNTCADCIQLLGGGRVISPCVRFQLHAFQYVEKALELIICTGAHSFNLAHPSHLIGPEEGGVLSTLATAAHSADQTLSRISHCHDQSVDSRRRNSGLIYTQYIWQHTDI